MAGVNQGSSNIMSPFGGMPNTQAGRFGRQFARPSSFAFGFDAPAGFESTLSEKAGEGNPFAQYLQTTRGLFAPMQADAAKAGQEIASRAPGLFDQYMQQGNSYLGQLGGMQQDAANINNAAQQALAESQSPIQSQALYQDALRQTLNSSREGAAGRGLLDSGGQQGQEDTISRGLASDFANRRFQEGQQAIQGAQGPLGIVEALGRAGIPVSQDMLAALPQFAQMLMAGSQIPFQTAQQLQSFIQTSQNPTLGLLQATAPQLGQESKGFNVL